MDRSLVVFLVVVVFFAYRGYKTGLFGSLSSILSLLAAYSVSIAYTGQVSPLLTAQFQMQGIIAYIAAALGLFFGAGFAVSFILRLLRKFLTTAEKPSVASSCGGLVIGSIVGFIVAVTTIWAFNFANDIRVGTVAGAPVLEDKSEIEVMANRVAGKTVGSAMALGSVSPAAASFGAMVAEHPAWVSRHSQQLMRSGDLHALLSDARNQSVMDSRDIEAVQRLPAFQQLVINPDFMALAKSAGKLTADNGQVSAVEKAILAQWITDLWGRVQRVRTHPRVQEIFADPGFQQKVQSESPLDLLTDPYLLELAEILFAAPVAVDSSAGESTKAVLQAG